MGDFKYFYSKWGNCAQIWEQTLRYIYMGFCFKQFSRFFSDDKCVSGKFLGKIPVWPKKDHSYPNLGPKAYMSCFQNQL